MTAAKVTSRQMKAKSRRRKSARPASMAPKRVAVPSTLTPLRSSFLNRSLKLIERIAATAPEHGLAEALSASTDVGTVARALSDSAVIGAVQEIEPLAAAIAKGAEHKQELIAEAGGLMTTAETATLLGISRQAVWKQRQERKLLSVRHGGEEKFPAIQFSRDGRPLPGLARILGAVGLEGGWGILDFLLTPDDDELDGVAPLDVLKKHPARIDDLVRLAAIQGEHGAG